METGFLNQLLTDRKYLIEYSRELKTAKEMREAKEDLMLSISAINITPKNREQLENSYQIIDGVAHIPIVGELTPHAETDICGAYTAEALTEYGFIIAASQAADNDPQVESIQYDVNSPGGYVDGLMGAVDSLRSVEKETIAYVTGMAASAAYWLASQTDKIILSSPAARVGSIGVAVEMYDYTKALEMEGIEKIVLTSTDAPLKRPEITTEEGQSLIVDSLDDMHKIFVQYVSEGRGVDIGDVTSNFGKGGMLIAENALRVGMIDEIEKVPGRRSETILDVIQTNTAAEVEIKQEVKSMNLDELKKENPGVFAEAVTLGIVQEKARQASLDEQLEADPNNQKLATLIAEAKANDKTVADIQTKLSVAVRDGKFAGENPPAVETAATVEALTEEDIKAAKTVGMSLEDYRKYSKEV